MAESIRIPYSSTDVSRATVKPRHSAIVRITHWLITLCFLALLLTGIEILISHPRFYWGETGNVQTPALFTLNIPSSRSTVPTGYGYVLPDQNGWSRYLHFEAAWVVFFTALLYATYGIVSGHFRKNLLPRLADLSVHSLFSTIGSHLRLRPGASGASSYNVIQRITYSLVVFVLFPLIIWTGLAMSPGIAAAMPSVVTILGGQQSARTLHFFLSILLVLFVLVHILMVLLSGFASRMRAMITGRNDSSEERS